jgi:hypothetical protein
MIIFQTALVMGLLGWIPRPSGPTHGGFLCSFSLSPVCVVPMVPVTPGFLSQNRMLIVYVPRNQVYTTTVQKMDTE